MKIKKLIKRIFFLVKCFFLQWKHFGFKIAFWSLLFPFYHLLRFLKYHLGYRKYRAILSYLSGKYAGIIEKFANQTTLPESAIDPISPIWVCWWDGEEAMPDLVKVCYKTIKQCADTHPVKLVTKHNFREYVSIPDYILEKVGKKVITITHFSDILRAALLFEYGGIWMDATLLVLDCFPFESMPFYTLKTTTRTNSISHIFYQGLSAGYKSVKEHNFSEVNRWSGFLLAGTKNSVLFGFMKELLYEYWKDQNYLIDYLLVDYTISLAADNVAAIKKMIEDVPCIDTDKFAIAKQLNAEYSEEVFAQYLPIPFHKLTWKEKFQMHTKDHKPTIYGYLINTYLNT